MLNTTRKGQYQVLEHVILIGAGLGVAMGFLYTFENFGEDIQSDVQSEHMEMLGKQTNNAIQHLLATEADGEVRITLPPDIAGDEYQLEFGDNGIMIFAGGQSHTTTMYGIEKQYNLEGTVTGDRDTAVIVKDGRTIRVEGT